MYMLLTDVVAREASDIPLITNIQAVGPDKPVQPVDFRIFEAFLTIRNPHLAVAAE